VLVSDPQLAATILGRGVGSLPRKSIGYGFFDLVGCGIRGGGGQVSEDLAFSLASLRPLQQTDPWYPNTDAPQHLYTPLPNRH